MTSIVMRSPRTESGGRPDPLLLASLLRAVASPADGLEHVAVRPSGEQIELVLFQTVPDATEPPAPAIAICRRALEITRQLSGWTVETGR
ncbi:hypothetical protein ABZ990_11505 [Streptomyces sp. NPDC046203]|uniref:hypothetical protein n=1 Tax=Streptomyces sp. NPDC046203 TaxID=3154602 RepID=UPI0033F676D4